MLIIRIKTNEVLHALRLVQCTGELGEDCVTDLADLNTRPFVKF